MQDIKICNWVSAAILKYKSGTFHDSTVYFCRFKDNLSQKIIKSTIISSYKFLE